MTDRSKEFMDTIKQADDHVGHLDDERVAGRAYQLWENDGRPEGQELDHWLRAEQELHGQSEEATPMPDRSEEPATSPAAKKPMK